MTRAAERALMIGDLVRVLAVLPEVEIGRWRGGPKALLAKFRRRGAHARTRDEAARARLRRVIAWVDRHFPGGVNCYRRALLEVALDPSAAAEPFRMGFRVAEGAVTGHAWIGAEEDGLDPYEAEFAL